MKLRVPELYFSIERTAFLLEFSEDTIRRRMKAGKFSPPGDDGKPDLSNIKNLDGDIRIPFSGVQFYLDSNPMQFDEATRARNRELYGRLKRGGDRGEA